MCYSKRPLDYAQGYFMVIPGKDEIYILNKCPKDIKDRLLKDWPKVREETHERHKKCIFLSTDYFY